MENDPTILDKIRNLFALAASADTEESRTAAHLGAKLFVEHGVGIFFPKKTHPQGSFSPDGVNTAPQFADVDYKFIKEVAPIIERGTLLSLNKGGRVSVNAMVMGYESAMNIEIPYATRKALCSKLVRMMSVRRKAGNVLSYRGRGGGYQLAPGYQYTVPTSTEGTPVIHEEEAGGLEAPQPSLGFIV